MIRINLLPPELRPQPQVRPLRLLALFVIFVVVITVVGGVVWAWIYRQNLIGDIEVITQKRIEYGPLYDKVIGMETTLAQIEKKLAGRQKLVTNLLDPGRALRLMEGLIPESVSYTNFTLGADRTVNINGSASDYYAVAALHLKLDLSTQFYNVVLAGAAKQDAGVGFNMSCNFREGAILP